MDDLLNVSTFLRIGSSPPVLVRAPLFSRSLFNSEEQVSPLFFCACSGTSAPFQASLSISLYNKLQYPPHAFHYSTCSLHCPFSILPFFHQYLFVLPRPLTFSCPLVYSTSVFYTAESCSPRKAVVYKSFVLHVNCLSNASEVRASPPPFLPLYFP
jgi:hypothetical protein